MKEILLSVIIPTYNVEKYLPACLGSLKEQDFQSYEVICIDDGSTDKTVGILESYAKDWEKLNLHAQPHKGPGAARNLGLADPCGVGLKGVLCVFLCYCKGKDQLAVFKNG